MAAMLDRLRMLQRGALPPPPVAALIGFTLRSIEPGLAVFDMEASERHANPMGTLHGGVLCDLADAAMGMAYGSTLGEGETLTPSGSSNATSSTTKRGWWPARPRPA